MQSLGDCTSIGNGWSESGSSSGPRNVYTKTPTKQDFSTLDDFVPPLKALERRKRAQDVISIFPEEVQLVRHVLPQPLASRISCYACSGLLFESQILMKNARRKR